MHPKTFYSTYQADPMVSALAEQMFTMINLDGCAHAFEFGAGEGKNLRRLNAKGVATFGIDISILNIFKAQAQGMGYGLADENYLRHFCNFDAVFTVSVLDHIEYIDDIVQELQRIANKVVYLIETNDVPGQFYYPHDYYQYGFSEITTWLSDGDGALYKLYKWNKQ